jgi:hypothetical protein
VRYLTALLMLCITASQLSVFAQTAPLTFALTDGTPVRLRLNRNLSSADSKTDDTVDFEVLEDVKVGGTVVIPKGSTAIGT